MPSGGCTYVPFHICGQGASQADGAGIINKNINATEFLRSLFNSFRNLILVPYVHNTREAFATSLLHYHIYIIKLLRTYVLATDYVLTLVETWLHI